MRPSLLTKKNSSVSKSVLARIKSQGERLWCFADFTDLPVLAVAKALSRLARKGELERLSKGLYYRSRTTTLGKSRPNPAAVAKLAKQKKSIYPAGLAAANLLGFTTQAPRVTEMATTALSLPMKLVGQDATVYTRRPEAWKELDGTEAALLDFLRRRGEGSELSPEKTIERLLSLLSQKSRFERLLNVADSEPPRVRAMLGALGEGLGKRAKSLEKLRDSLNPLSNFDFGVMSHLATAKDWQARRRGEE